ncbi:60S ribosomal protein [Schistosoma japonicum]|uniref:Large ribosomal subunit protein eL6 n=1 Tax=Schistosoma japonicum TaxID=6182 RepID=A0A4Z2D078_SCHJA|nr:60S ribosomal protein [Schistosoma japonicum]TNN09912.1 60S ribosomal protein [Schistosoma japonicum]
MQLHTNESFVRTEQTILIEQSSDIHLDVTNQTLNTPIDKQLENEINAPTQLSPDQSPHDKSYENVEVIQSIDTTIISNEELISVDDEKLTKQKLKDTDENHKNDNVSSMQIDEDHQYMPKSYEHFKSINTELNNLSDELTIPSHNQSSQYTQQFQLSTDSINSNASEIKCINKSKKKQKHSLDTVQHIDEVIITPDSNSMLNVISNSEHNELSSIITSNSDNYEIKLTDSIYNPEIVIQSEISTVQLTENNNDIKQLLTEPSIEKPSRRSRKKHKLTKTIQPSNYLLTSESTASISTDSEHSEPPNDSITLSSTSIEIPVKTDVSCNDSINFPIRQDEIFTTTPSFSSTSILTDSYQSSKRISPIDESNSNDNEPYYVHDYNIPEQIKEKAIDKSGDDVDSCCIVNDLSIETNIGTIYLDHDNLPEVNTLNNVETISLEPMNEDYFIQSIVQNQLNETNIPISDETFPEFSCNNLLSNILKEEEILSKEYTMKSESINSFNKQQLNESQFILPKDETNITEILQTSSIIPENDFLLTSECINTSMNNTFTHVQSSMKQEVLHELTTQLTSSNSELNNEHEKIDNKSLKQSKKKQKKSIHSLEETMQTMEYHTAITSTDNISMLTSTMVTSVVSQSPSLFSSSNMNVEQSTLPLINQANNKQSNKKKNKKVKSQSVVSESYSLKSMPTSSTSLLSISEVFNARRNRLKKSNKTSIFHRIDASSNDQLKDNQTSNEIIEKESQENTRKRRFPKSFITQVDPKYTRSNRLSAKRQKLNESKELHQSSINKNKSFNKQNRKQKIIKKWHLRSSLNEIGVILILLAGRHRGKRVVYLGRQKSTGLLLVTGPYCYNGCPLRRIHPDYVIATKTKIDLSNFTLPQRIHQKAYFTRSTYKKFNKHVTKHKSLQDLLEYDNTNKSMYQPNDEKRIDQIYIDNEIKKAIKLHNESKMLINYLKSLFSIGKYDRPHEMLF